MSAKVSTSVSASAAGLPLEQFLTYRLAILNGTLNRQAGAMLRKVAGLGLPEWRVIALLGAKGPLNATMIGHLSGADRGLLSRTLRSLEKRRLLLTVRDQVDQRVVRATLTANGRALYEKTLPHMQARQRGLLERLSERERIEVFRIIDNLIGAARSSGADETDP